MKLPQTAQDIVDVIGMDATMALVRRYPGIPLKVPKGRRLDGAMVQRLSSDIGQDAALKFIRHYKGEVVVIPRCADALRVMRNKQIIAQYGNGTTVADLAREYKLTVRQIRSVLNSPDVAVAVQNRTDPRQLMMDF